VEHDPKHLQAVMQQAAPPDLDLSFRPMFGGILAYLDGKAFASLRPRRASGAAGRAAAAI
jgi:hypothetical protein